MAKCNQTKRLANENWPLYETTNSEACCYVVTVDNAETASNVIEDAKGKPDYIKQSQFFEMPGKKIRFYLYFNEEN